MDGEEARAWLVLEEESAGLGNCQQRLPMMRPSQQGKRTTLVFHVAAGGWGSGHDSSARTVHEDGGLGMASARRLCGSMEWPK
jgi:hypothetical protein